MARMMILTVLFLTVGASAAVARAQTGGSESSAVIEARQRFTLAEQRFDAGDYATALVEWQRVYELLDGRPQREYVWYNIARANEELGRTRAAIDAYQSYLEHTPDSAPNRPEAQRHLQELRLRLELDHQSSPASQPPTTAQFSPSPLGIAIAIVGAAAVAAGGVIGGIALAEDQSGRAQCEGTRCTPSAFAALGDAHMLAGIADGLLFGGLAIAATGIILTFLLGETSQNGVASACDPTGCGLTAWGRF